MNKAESENQSNFVNNNSNAVPPEINPDPEDPKDNKDQIDPTEQKQVVKDEFQNNISLKETKVYRDAKNQITANTERFEKLGLKPISNKDLKHIVNNHTKVGEVARQRSLSDKTSFFKDDINLIELILDAWEFGEEIWPGSKEYDCAKIVGTTKTGEPTSIIQVSLNKTSDAIRTAFPR